MCPQIRTLGIRINFLLPISSIEIDSIDSKQVSVAVNRVETIKRHLKDSLMEICLSALYKQVSDFTGEQAINLCLIYNLHLRCTTCLYVSLVFCVDESRWIQNN